MAKKFYAVKVGRKTGIFETWAECQKQINGFSGAIHKSFATKADAEAFIGADSAVQGGAPGTGQDSANSAGEGNMSGGTGQDNVSGSTGRNSVTGGREQDIVSGSGVQALEETQAVAYVDGSYDAAANAFSYGMVLFHNGRELHFSDKYTDEALAQMHNVAGEIKGAEAAMRYCLDNDIPSITIYHDYEGIARWCNGEWQAKKEGTIAYAEYYKKASAKVHIRFVKVKGHSGDTYNELADRLAKAALGIV